MDGDIIEPKERDLSVQGLFGYTHVEPKEWDIGSDDTWIHTYRTQGVGYRFRG